MKDLITIQKEIAKEVLEALEVIDPSCLLAGGAPRDWFFGKPATDLDFYVYDARDLGQTVWLDRLNKTLLDVEILGNVEGKTAEDVDCEYSSMEHLRYVFEGKYMGMTVQVMVMSVPTYSSVLNHFCSDICKIWWKGNKVIPTIEFMLAHATRTINVADHTEPKKRYLTKMMEKFPSYRLVMNGEAYTKRVKRFQETAEARSSSHLVSMWVDLSGS